MRNLVHASASVATHYGARSPTTTGRLPGWGSVIRLWFARSHQRRALAELDDRLLRDIGVTRMQARREATKPFWSASKA